MLLIFALAALAARGAERPEHWAMLYEARLALAMNEASRDAEALLADLVGRLDPLDPLRGEAAYWLARARLARGEEAGARVALALALEDPDIRERALALEAEMDAAERTVTRLPLTCTMDRDAGPLVHSWLHGDRGRLDIAVPQGERDPALRWTARVRERADDQLTATLAESAWPMHGIRMDLQAEGFPVYLRVLVVDDRDREYATEPLVVAPGRWTRLELPLSSFHPTDPTSTLRHPPGRVANVHLHDVTAWLSADRGQRVVWIDDLEIW